MENQQENKIHITDLQLALCQAAFNLAEAVCEDLHQEDISGIESIAQPNLWELMMAEVKTGSLEALMTSALVQGNQSKGAKVFNVNRATLRKYLKETGLLPESIVEAA